MPTYDYQCSSCGHTFERVTSISKRKDQEALPCPECKTENTVSQIIGSPMIAYSYSGNMKTTDSFNDRLKEIRKKLPAEHRDKISQVIR